MKFLREGKTYEFVNQFKFPVTIHTPHGEKVFETPEEVEDHWSIAEKMNDSHTCDVLGRHFGADFGGIALAQFQKAMFPDRYPVKHEMPKNFLGADDDFEKEMNDDVVAIPHGIVDWHGLKQEKWTKVGPKLWESMWMRFPESVMDEHRDAIRNYLANRYADDDRFFTEADTILSETSEGRGVVKTICEDLRNILIPPSKTIDELGY